MSERVEGAGAAGVEFPETDALAELLAEHRDDMEPGDYGEVLWSGCTCGDEHPYDQHDLHLADVILGYLSAKANLGEIDRNARAYGWEIGRGHPLVEQIESTNPDNPFLAADWREQVCRPGHPAQPAAAPSAAGGADGGAGRG